MKKVLLILLIGLILALILVACDLFGVAEICKHDNPIKIVVVKAKDPTCQEIGLTEGMKCLNCDAMVLPQTIIPVIDCIEGEPILYDNFTYHTECIMCGRVMREGVVDNSNLTDGSLYEAMPDGGSFEKVDISSYELPVTIKEAHKASNGGYVFYVEFAGFNPGNIAVVGVSADGKVTGTKVTTNVEALGWGALTKLDENGHYNGADFSTIDEIDTIAGCTFSTKAYRAVVKDALNAALILSGGEVDLRDPAQIDNDNLNAALGTEGVEFDKHFFTEVVEGVDAIYVAKTGEGHVVVIGKEFIGVDAEGNVVGEANATAANAIAKIKSTTVTDIDISAFSGVSKRVKSAQVTNEGIYILEVEGSGFGKKGASYLYPSGEYIVVRIALTADGKIIDCYTVYQSETNGFGSVCGNEEFYGQFAGKTQDNYEDIIIAGCTYTTDGYHGAIQNAFKAVAIFEGIN